MKCPNCGNDLIPGALFCASCGNKIPEELLNATTTQGASEPVTTPTEETPVATAEAPTVTQETHVAGAPQPAAPTMEQQMPYQNAAASQIPTGTPVMPGMETDTDKKKKTTRIIGVAAVA
ncbi:MAG: zinc-ribbon domain-containing protein, partial [Wujia sp.]